VQDVTDWLLPLPDAEQMRAVDRAAIEQYAIPGVDLMERAGTHVARAVERAARDGRVAVLCGTGNNGGDGLVAARVLRAAGREVTVVCVGDPAGYRGDAAVNMTRLAGEGPRRLDGTPWQGFGAAGDPLAGATVLVDALLGTGFQGSPRDEAARAIELINGHGAPVVAVDVPSGIDADDGTVPGVAVRADVTVTFHAAKVGLWVHPGKGHAGTVQVVDIGIPASVHVDTSAGLATAAVAAGLPRRGAESSKFTSGHVVVVGGSRELAGAPRMAAAAAMRAGAGYVSVCVPAAIQPSIAAGMVELMGHALPEEQGALSPVGADETLELAARAGALVVGPGLGRSGGARELTRELASASPVPFVLDADGIAAFDGDAAALAERAAAAVITPHAGELGRLLGVSSEEVQARRLAHARAAAARCSAITVLKGDDTIVALPDGRVAISPGDSPALATAGTGDVLSGVIGALLAEGCEPVRAACAAVWLHAEAGRVAAREHGAAEGVVASDVIAALPRARAAADGR